LPLAWFVTMGDRGASVGFDLEGVAPRDYFLTQAGVLPTYLRLILWPHPLVLDYDGWKIAHSLSEVWLPGLAVLATLLAALVALARRRAAGILATAAFVVLAPTSTFVPLSGAVVGEHRTYLVVAVVLTLAGLGLHALLRRVQAGEARTATTFAVGGLLLTLTWGATTMRRQFDYQSELTIWQDTVEKRPDNPRAWSSLGVVHAERGELEAAESAYREALRLSPHYVRAMINLGNLHMRRGALAEAAAIYARAAAEGDDLAEAHYYAGSTQVALGDARSGIPHLRRALELRLDPRLQNPCRIELAWALATATDDALRDGPEALQLATLAQPPEPRVRDLDVFAAALAENGRFGEAVSTLEAVLRQLGESAYARELQQRLDTYRSGRGWRQ
jgi:tetratricopeptide (TPR) repeat protein